MIIWGSTGKQKEVANGNFFCPQCMAFSPYSQIRVSRYFTLYFIPLFETSVLGEAVVCRTCKGEFRVEVLSLRPEHIQAAVRPWGCGNCGNRNPASEEKCLGCGTPKGTVPPPLPSAPPPLPARSQDLPQQQGVGNGL